MRQAELAVAALDIAGASVRHGSTVVAFINRNAIRSARRHF